MQIVLENKFQTLFYESFSPKKVKPLFKEKVDGLLKLPREG